MNGVKGIGAKGATSLVEEHGTIANAMAKLDALEGRLAKALKASKPDVVVLCTSSSIKKVMPQIETILGYSQEEWMGDASLCIDRIHPDDRDRVVAACELANEAGDPYSAEYRMIIRDGRIVRMRDEAVLVRGSNGQPLCWQGVMRDITPPTESE